VHGQESVPQSGGSVVENLAFAAMHQVGFHRIAVVVADQMEGAVRGEEVELECERYAEPARLSGRRLGGDDELADERSRVRRFKREREHIGAPPDATVGRVEPTDLRIIHHGDLDDASRSPDGRQRAIDGAGQACA
jgi:hypothetical protein